MSIDIEAIKNRIDYAIQRKDIIKDLKLTTLREALIAQVNIINEQYLEDAKKLCELYSFVKSKKCNFNDSRFKADRKDIIGFRDDSDRHGNKYICLCVRGCVGFNNTCRYSLAFARHGKNLEAYIDVCEENDICDAIEALNKLEDYDKMYDLGILINTLINGFEFFRDDYIMAVNTMISQLENTR